MHCSPRAQTCLVLCLWAAHHSDTATYASVVLNFRHFNRLDVSGNFLIRLSRAYSHSYSLSKHVLSFLCRTFRFSSRLASRSVSVLLCAWTRTLVQSSSTHSSPPLPSRQLDERRAFARVLFTRNFAAVSCPDEHGCVPSITFHIQGGDEGPATFVSRALPKPAVPPGWRMEETPRAWKLIPGWTAVSV